MKKFRKYMPLPEGDYFDWELTGQQEMNDLCERHKHASSNVGIRDRLTNLKDLVSLCIEALGSSELVDVRYVVKNVLHFHVQKQLELAEKELAQAWT